MKRKRHSSEQVIRKLREADRMLSEGKTIAEVCQQLEIVEATAPRVVDSWSIQLSTHAFANPSVAPSPLPHLPLRQASLALLSCGFVACGAPACGAGCRWFESSRG